MDIEKYNFTVSQQKILDDIKKDLFMWNESSFDDIFPYDIEEKYNGKQLSKKIFEYLFNLPLVHPVEGSFGWHAHCKIHLLYKSFFLFNSQVICFCLVLVFFSLFFAREFLFFCIFCFEKLFFML